ncbi:MAG: hypothetical protein GX473_06635 [Candidatus Fermentibacter daniensis]|nr:hypothetical protein [Candidatus Fermentibacter sp.]NLI02984.1 hypothetical protein [Candidatus Fermentibacter daniensis]
MIPDRKALQGATSLVGDTGERAGSSLAITKKTVSRTRTASMPQARTCPIAWKR